MEKRLMAYAVAFACAGFVGCGDTSATDSEKIAQLEARVEAAEKEAAAAQSVAQKVDDDAATAEDSTDTASETVPGKAVDEDVAESTSSSDCIRVPNVVGKDHQLAQDTMQAAGLYYLAEQDASGHDRMLLLDRNWTTVKQRPEAGKCVSDDTEIMLYAVKDDER